MSPSQCVCLMQKEIRKMSIDYNCGISSSHSVKHLFGNACRNRMAPFSSWVKRGEMETNQGGIMRSVTGKIFAKI